LLKAGCSAKQTGAGRGKNAVDNLQLCAMFTFSCFWASSLVVDLTVTKSAELHKELDILYSNYMRESVYREVLRRARADLGSAIAKRNDLLERLEATEKEIAQLKRLIGGVHAYVDESERQEDLLEANEGLKGAVCTALRAANRDVTISDILSILQELQFPIESHQNPLGSIYTTVTRLVADGEVFPGEPLGDKKTYRWARATGPGLVEAEKLVATALIVAGKAVKKR
jgi:hypothetical protein